MALNFDKIISESDNVSLEDLSIESLVQGDLHTNSKTFNDLFEDHLSVLRSENHILEDYDTNDCIFDLDLECMDIDKMWISECDIANSFQFDSINITDLDSHQSNLAVDSDIVFVNDDTYVNDNTFFNEKESTDTSKKNSTTTRRQSTRIENQTRKKIAEQIQRENIRLAMEAQFLNNKDYKKKKKESVHIINGKPASPEMERYLSLPTDLDAEDEEENGDIVNNVETTSDDDPNKVWCLCRKPYGDRFMICCDNCLEWYHGDCVSVTQQEGADMDEFICPLCVANLPAVTTPKKPEEVVIIDDEEDDDQELIDDNDDDCLITKAVEPMKFHTNIFQLINVTQNTELAKPKIEIPPMKVTSLSKRTSVCLNQTCKTLVNPKKSLYCSRVCIDKYTKMVIKNNLREKAKQYGLPRGPKLAKMTRFVLAQPATETIQDEYAAPTEDTLKEFLIKNPTYKVYQSAKPIKSNQEKSKKILEIINRDPSKHIKIVKLFATFFKKFMAPKSFNLEFRNIWEHCLKVEESLFLSCDKVINEKYVSKVKELSEYFKKQDNDRFFWDILHNKLTVTDLLSLTIDQLDARSKVIILDDPPVTSLDKSDITRKSYAISKGIISLLSDTTHLHSRHLYDINCKICNGAKNKMSNGSKDGKLKEKDGASSLDSTANTEFINVVKIQSPSNNDECTVTSSVETPDMVVDMEICSSSSEKDELDSKRVARTGQTDNEVDSSSVMKPNTAEMMNIVKPQKRKLTPLWEGNLTYKEVGSVMCKSFLVARIFLNKDMEKEQEPLPENDNEIRDLLNLSTSLNSEIIISGRSQMSETHNYLQRLRKHSNKEYIVLRLHPSNLDEGGNLYRAMFDFLHGRERCGVISNKRMGVKDCFIYPLNAHVKVPSIFQPYIGSGLEKRRPHLLLLIIVRTPLSHMEYQPISPKYDQDDDFVRKHGINLDKYSQPNLSIPFCPSPLVNATEVVRWVINSKYDQDEKKMIKIGNIIEVKDSKLANCDNESYGANTQESYRDTEKNPISEDLCNVDILKNKSETKKSDKENQETSPGVQYEDDMVPEIPVIRLCDIPLPDDISDDVGGSEKEVIIPTKTVETETVRCPSPLAPEISIRPTPFVYRSLVSRPVLKVLPHQSISQEEEPRSFVKERKVGVLEGPGRGLDKDLDCGQFFSHDSHSEVLLPMEIDFCGDVDLRFNQSKEQLIMTPEHVSQTTVSKKVFLKRRHSSRLYTLYDSSIDTVDLGTKRERYFFNPYCPTTDIADPESPLLVDSDEGADMTDPYTSTYCFDQVSAVMRSEGT